MTQELDADRERFERSARSLQISLLHRFPSTFRLVPLRICVRDETGGWSCNLGDFATFRTAGVELWLDRFVEPHRRRFWYGLSSDERHPLESIFERMDFKDKKTIPYEYDLSPSKIFKPLELHEYKYIFFEHCEANDEFYLGKYDLGESPGGEVEYDQAIEFFLTLLPPRTA